MEKFVLRHFENSDQDAIWRLHIEGLKQTGSYIEGLKLDSDLKNITPTYLDAGGEFFVALLNNIVIGMGALRRVDDETGEIKRMRIDPRYQGRGIGSLILGRLIEKAYELGCERIILDTTESQHVARRLYEKKGFREYKREKRSGLGLIYYKLYLNK